MDLRQEVKPLVDVLALGKYRCVWVVGQVADLDDVRVHRVVGAEREVPAGPDQPARYGRRVTRLRQHLRDLDIEIRGAATERRQQQVELVRRMVAHVVPRNADGGGDALRLTPAYLRSASSRTA